MWINVNTKKVYKTHSEFRSDFPKTSFPPSISSEIMSGFGVVSLHLSTKPIYNYTKNILESDPIFTDGRWVQTWGVTDATVDEIAQRTESQAQSVRKQRDNLLSKTDWWVLPDRTATQEQIDYRQALRDITDHVNFPYLTEADWPVKPE